MISSILAYVDHLRSCGKRRTTQKEFLLRYLHYNDDTVLRDLHVCSVHFDNKHYLREVMRACMSLSSLSLEDLYLTWNEKQNAEPLFHFLRSNKNLRRICLSDYFQDSRIIGCILEEAAINSSLETLCLYHLNFSLPAKYLVHVLQSSRSLKRLELECVDFCEDSISMEPRRKQIQTNSKDIQYLQELALMGYNFQCTTDAPVKIDTFNFLASLVQKAKALQVLEVSYCYFDEETTEAFQKVLQSKDSRLETVSIRETSFENKNFEAVIVDLILSKSEDSKLRTIEVEYVPQEEDQGCCYPQQIMKALEGEQRSKLDSLIVKNIQSIRVANNLFRGIGNLSRLKRLEVELEVQQEEYKSLRESLMSAFKCNSSLQAVKVDSPWMYDEDREQIDCFCRRNQFLPQLQANLPSLDQKYFAYIIRYASQLQCAREVFDIIKTAVVTGRSLCPHIGNQGEWKSVSHGDEKECI